MPENFVNYAPTPDYSAYLKKTADEQKDAENLVQLAEEVADNYAEYLKGYFKDIYLEGHFKDIGYSYEPDEKSKKMRQEIEADLGFDKPYYTPVNDCAVWRALIWMALDREQWRMIVDYWQDNPDLNPNAMRGMYSESMPHNNAPAAMLCVRHKAYQLVLLEPPCRPEVALQIGAGTVSDEVVGKFHHMCRERSAIANQKGWPPYRWPVLALIYGVVYYHDECQWGTNELELSQRDANARIFVQTLNEHNGYYVPL